MKNKEKSSLAHLHRVKVSWGCEKVYPSGGYVVFIINNWRSITKNFENNESNFVKVVIFHDLKKDGFYISSEEEHYSRIVLTRMSEIVKKLDVERPKSYFD